MQVLRLGWWITCQCELGFYTWTCCSKRGGFIIKMKSKHRFFTDLHLDAILVGVSYFSWHRNRSWTSILVSCNFPCSPPHLLHFYYPFAGPFQIKNLLCVVKKVCPIDSNKTICFFLLLLLLSLPFLSCLKGSLEGFKLIFLWIRAWLISGSTIIWSITIKTCNHSGVPRVYRPSHNGSPHA